MLKIDILTVFPEMFRETLNESIIGRGVSKGLLDLNFFQIRDYTENKQKKVDDYPYGGGPGLIMGYQPIRAAYDAAVEKAGQKPYVIYMSPQGNVLSQKVAKRLSQKPYLMVVCGHYEGIDERLIEDIVDEEISIGDYVLTGGEIPAMALCDCVGRLVPGVLASEDATENESHSANCLLEYPQYTRPEEIAGRGVPEVLLGGNHGDIEKWRFEKSLERTKKKRPDLYEKFIYSKDNPDFPVYLDNSATTAVCEAVIEEMNDVYRKYFGNPSSLHHLGVIAEKKLRECREFFAGMLNAKSSEITFTSGGSESNNTALFGYARANRKKGNRIIISAVEHPSVGETAAALAEEGFSVAVAPVNKSGIVDLDALKNLLTEDTILVSVMHVNSETGGIQPVREISLLIAKYAPNAAFHVDAVQSFGKLKTDVADMGIDMLSVSSHKIRGPRGVGLLYVRKGLKIKPLIYGGGQENGLRSGTENLAGIAGFTKAAEIMKESLNENYASVTALRDTLCGRISEKFGEKAIITTDTEVSSPYILNVSFPGLRAEVILHSLESQNVFVSVGSACSSNKKNRSAVLSAMGYSNEVIDGAVRFSFSADNDTEDIEKAFSALCRTVRELKKAQYTKKAKKGDRNG